MNPESTIKYIIHESVSIPDFITGNVKEHTAQRLNRGDILTPPSTDFTPTNQTTISSFLRLSPFRSSIAQFPSVGRAD